MVLGSYVQLIVAETDCCLGEAARIVGDKSLDPNSSTGGGPPRDAPPGPRTWVTAVNFWGDPHPTLNTVDHGQPLDITRNSM